MRRFPRFVASILLTLGVALPALAQESRQAFRAPRHRFIRCLAILDLSAQQRIEIFGLVEAARPALEADVAALRSAAETLKVSLEANPPDACQIGNDALAVRAARQALVQEGEALRDRIAGTLTPEQLSRLEGCFDFPLPDGGDGIDDLIPE